MRVSEGVPQNGYLADILAANFVSRWMMARSVAWPLAFLRNFLLAARLRSWIAGRGKAPDAA
ncbi:hypothetical protein EKL30_09085 [Candidimonas sp. SYP-B2681]|uniref:hypothetical protein n=1 Tax=Candidimonas sp. SYP-B2681 TaxID=2497686 RepID=UPI000F870A4D|nr:hypothetical protein [Candidimonas sp. SYP-B2681]RTZ44702.1 hypothetical protein EKL30_09085 [Candidimonas sp. SYP-B2681]